MAKLAIRTCLRSKRGNPWRFESSSRHKRKGKLVNKIRLITGRILLFMSMLYLTLVYFEYII